MFHLAICSPLLGILREEQRPADGSANNRPVCVRQWEGQFERIFSLLSTRYSGLMRLKRGKWAASKSCGVSKGTAAAGNLTGSQNIPARNLSLNPEESRRDI